MPTSREIVSNKPLAGTELAAIIRSDIARMLDESGFLAGQSAYSRVAYDIRITLHLDLPAMPTATEVAQSRVAASDVIAQRPELGSLEPFPLAQPSAGAALSATGLRRDIDSPNLARVEHSLPVTVDVLGEDGHTREELVTYRPGDVGMDATEFRDPDLTDLTPEVRRELGL
jgi:hypothetical protein